MEVSGPAGQWARGPSRPGHGAGAQGLPEHPRQHRRVCAPPMPLNLMPVCPSDRWAGLIGEAGAWDLCTGESASEADGC